MDHPPPFPLGEGPLFFGTDALQVWPMYQLRSEGWAKGGDITGRLLYDRDGQTYTAPYYFLGEAALPDTGFLSLGTARTDIYAGFSLPREGENRRGYLTYTMFNTESGYSIISYFNYTHQHTWFQYPATTALKRRRWELSRLQLYGPLCKGNDPVLVYPIFGAFTVAGLKKIHKKPSPRAWLF